jgi:hypothetical protein
VVELARDTTPTDGWMLPVNASKLPTGEHRYTVRLLADADDPTSEIATRSGPFVVTANDGTPAWPWILPGETANPTNPHGAEKITVETVEPSNVALRVNGQRVPTEPWTPPPRDPGPAEPEDRPLGTGVQANVSVEPGDVIRAKTTDENGNAVAKAVLVGHGVQEPALKVRVPSDGPLTVRPSSTIGGAVGLANLGTEPTSYELTLDAPDAWDGTASPSAGLLEPDRATLVRLTVNVPANASPMDTLGIGATYEASNGTVDTRFEIPTSVEDSEPLDDNEGSLVTVPAPPAALALGLAVLLATRKP